MDSPFRIPNRKTRIQHINAFGCWNLNLEVITTNALPSPPQWAPENSTTLLQKCKKLAKSIRKLMVKMVNTLNLRRFMAFFFRERFLKHQHGEGILKNKPLGVFLPTHLPKKRVILNLGPIISSPNFPPKTTHLPKKKSFGDLKNTSYGFSPNSSLLWYSHPPWDRSTTQQTSIPLATS